MEKKNHIVILTGAGISQESGIKTFRDSNGLWENHKIEDVASPLGFAKNPKLVLDFYNLRREQLMSDEVSPNKAHTALAALEKEYDGKVTIITQNIDDLHERAGSTNVLHMHGELLKMRCINCNNTFDVKDKFDQKNRCPGCKKIGLLRPDIVWFGETPYFLDEIESILNDCDLFISIGTSGNVYPAAGFVQLVKAIGKAQAIEVNIEGTEISNHFDQHMIGNAGEKVSELVNYILKGV
ncbi:MAG: NAD-dependent deacylase [Bacteriovoracaceae bacterium]|nr:NAD-dependent deacylase [Bacteriovoracaceae bacterium]